VTWSVYGRRFWEPSRRDGFCPIGVFAPETFKPEAGPRSLPASSSATKRIFRRLIPLCSVIVRKFAASTRPMVP
jgi:hypothetical protein